MRAENQQTLNYALTTRLLVAGGVIAPLLFTGVYLIEGATRPGYDAWSQAVSALSLSDQGWLQITNFVICGLLIIGFAAGVRQTFRSGRSATWGPILLAIVGLGLIFAGLFVTDPGLGYPPGTPEGPTLHPTLHGNIHFLAGAIGFFCFLPASCFVFARRFVGDPQWKGWAIGSVLAGILMLVAFVTFAIIGASVAGGPAGLLERISLTSGLAWMACFASRLLSQMRVPASLESRSRNHAAF